MADKTIDLGEQVHPAMQFIEVNAGDQVENKLVEKDKEPLPVSHSLHFYYVPVNADMAPDHETRWLSFDQDEYHVTVFLTELGVRNLIGKLMRTLPEMEQFDGRR